MRLVIWSLVVLAVACGTADPNERCNPGAEQACNCPDGIGSVEECQSDGKWGVCQCSGL
jgi:hypothetical protein